MATEYPPLGKSYVISYSNGDKDFPIIAIKKDPRVDNYRRPDDLSPHPDSTRYPNHVFTGTQPTNTDERVIWIYEILPSPWVPFTRYDDDLGPVQGRRRSVANTGQEASLERDKRVTYEAREGSAIVSTELEETWDAGSTDPDAESPFPIKDRDFYDASRGAVQERRQLRPTTGDEVANLENNNGIITETSYEAYNEFLSFKIVRTYKVNGPSLVGRATDNDGQLVTIVTQRKASLNYVPPNPTATRTVEASPEDAESFIERIVDTPEVFSAKTFSKERPDPIPQKFRVAIPSVTEQETLAGQAEVPTLSTGEFNRSEQQVNKFVKRLSKTTRNQSQLPQTLTQKTTTNDGLLATVSETLQEDDTEEEPTATKSIQSEALGDGNYVVTVTELPKVFENKSLSVERPDPAPQKFRIELPTTTTQQTFAGDVEDSLVLEENELSKSEQQVTEFVKRVSITSREETASGELVGQALTTDLNGGIANVVEIYGEDQDIDVGFGTVSAEKETLGDNKVLIRKVVLEPEVRTGQIYDDTLDISYPFEREIIQAGQTSEGSEIQPRDHLHSVKTTVDKNAAKSELLATEFTMPEIVSISLPDRLTSVSLNTYYTSNTPVGSGSGVTFSSTVGAIVTTDSILNYNIKNGYNGPIQATKHIFFLEKNATIEEIESKLSAERWPTVITEPARIEIIEYSERAESQGSTSLPNNISYQTNKNVSTSAKIVEIPPTLHGSFSIGENPSGTSSASASGAVSSSIATIVIVASASGSVRFTPSIPATSPYTRFPSGKYIYSMNCSPYRYGLIRVDAITVDITDAIT